MLQPYKSYKMKYRFLFHTDIWKKAKALLHEYFLDNGKLICPICEKNIPNKFTLHHETGFYHKEELFSPCYTQLIHNQCHKRIHASSKTRG